MTIMRPSQRIHRVPGYGIRDSRRAVSADASWWLLGGVDPANVAGVWQPIGAASLAASYLRIAGDEGYANIDPAVVGGVAPTWAAATGWQGDGSAWLSTGVFPNAGYSVIVSFSGAPLNAYKAFCGSYTDAARWLSVEHFTIPASSILVRNGNTNYISAGGANLASGVYAVAGQADFYINGVAQTANLGAWSGGAGTVDIAILAVKTSTIAAGRMTTAKIAAVAIYSATLTPTQVALISAGAAALT